MGLIGLTAVEVLAFCLGLGLVLAVLIVVCNCVSTCCEMFSHRRKKQKVEKLPDDYVDEIHRLLHNNRKICEYDCVVIDSKSVSTPLKTFTQNDEPSSIDGNKPKYMSDSRLETSMKNEMSTVNEEPIENENNNTSTTSSQSTCGEEKKRRTWGRLSNSLFDTILMPSIDTTTTEDDGDIQSNSVDMGRFGIKIETTV